MDVYGVTPCVGVWIETDGKTTAKVAMRHTLRGCVD